jgi:gamma-glutamylcyclotransferase (GGCT)/AIG2-like uncharacterized protein YtfP
MKGMVHFDKLASLVTQAKPATCQGTLYRLAVGYPAMVEGTGTVKGELLTLESFKDIINIIDEFEGYSVQNPEKSLCQRVEREVKFEDGTSEMAWVYLLNPDKLPKDAKLIESGNYRSSLEAQKPLPMLLNESQKKYILKLGASSGRDIVPINLDIYRDLLNKGLIVDKGRRLALTNLGFEVFKFLA